MNSNALKKNEPLLTDAWQRFADYDLNSKQQQKSFSRLQYWILLLGGTASFLALLHTQLVKVSSLPLCTLFELILRWTVIMAPISISILMTVSNVFSPGNKWIFLRRAAEEIKSEIYRYRTLSHIQFINSESISDKTWEEKLRKKIDDIDSWVSETDVGKIVLKQYEGKLPPSMDKASQCDDGFSLLNAEQYMEIRLGDQLNFYRDRSTKFSRKIKQCHWSIVIIGGIGTFLAAIGVALWVSFTTTLVGIFTTYLEYRQLENNLMIYNQASHSLVEIKGWWSDLSDDMKDNSLNIMKLVETTERVLQSELSRWIHNMKSALQELKSQTGLKGGKK